MTSILVRVGDLLRRLLSFVVGALLLAIVLLVCVQVFSRYFIGAATPGMAEISRLLFIWLTFLGAALLISRRELIVIDFLHDKLNADLFKRLGILIDLATAAFLVMLIVYARHLMAVVGQKIAPATGLPFGWFYGSIVAFAGLGLFFIIERILTPSAAARREAQAKAKVLAEGHVAPTESLPS
jgi:TRAP-type C4-dicarboxylate transport system permease small subunit